MRTIRQKPHSSEIKNSKISPNIEFEHEVKKVDDSCISATVTVRARDVIGPPMLEFCRDGSYEGLVELVYRQ